MKICVLSSGSKGNCTYIETKNHKILIDVGTSSLYIEKSLISLGINPNDIDLILVTHAHIDHVKGLKVFNKKYKPLIYISKLILEEANLISEHYNILEDLSLISDIKITELKLSHDVKDIKGYIIEEGKCSSVYITDTGYINEKHFELLKNKSVYVFESNHDVEMLMNNPNYPHSTKIRILSDKGHLSNKDSSYYLSKFIGDNTQYVVLAHLSEQNNNENIALDMLKSTLNSKNITAPNLLVAHQNELTEVLEI